MFSSVEAPQKTQPRVRSLVPVHEESEKWDGVFLGIVWTTDSGQPRVEMLIYLAIAFSVVLLTILFLCRKFRNRHYEKPYEFDDMFIQESPTADLSSSDCSSDIETEMMAQDEQLEGDEISIYLNSNDDFFSPIA